MKTILIIFLFTIFFLGSVRAQESNMVLSSPSFANNGKIPSKYTCDGMNINPSLQIKNIPVHTVSLALVMYDPDVNPGIWFHWAIYGIDPKESVIKENAHLGKEVINDFHQYNYGGPCPPAGETHHYIFEVYALDTNFTFNENGSPQGLLQKIRGHILDQNRLVGLYKKN